MKNLIYILLAVLILASCDDSDPTNPTPEPEICPAPVEIPGIGYHVPSAHSLQEVSMNKELLAFKNHSNILKILNLKSGELIEYNLQNYLPEKVLLENIQNISWSPYDNHRLLIQATTKTDTSLSEDNYILGTNLYFFDINQKTLDNISPSEWGPTGWYIYFEDGAAYVINLIWLDYSMNGKDIIIVRDKIYIPQEDTFSEIIEHFSRDTYFSDDAIYSLTWSVSPPLTQQYVLSIYNGLNLEETVQHEFYYSTFSRAQNISWSPDNKYIAISGKWFTSYGPPNETRYFEIWIVAFQEFLIEADKNGAAYYSLSNVFNVINLRNEYCKYAFSKDPRYSIMGTEFISDTTMAVSMHEDGAQHSYLYEISIHGEMIRQLTFEP